MRTWLWRLFWVAVLYAGLDLAMVRLDFEPDHGRLALLVLLSAAVLALVWDTLGDSGPPWTVVPLRPVVQAGSEQRLAGYVRLIESHLTASQPDAALRDRLATLCDERLARRHGLTRHDPGAEALLGSDMLRDLAGPVRRLTRADVDRYLERIESL